MRAHSHADFWPRKLSLEEWAELSREEPGELVDGVLVEEEMPGFVHEVIVAWLAELFRRWGGRRVLVASSGARYGVAPSRGRMPDLSVFLPGAARPPARGPIRVPPSIAVEILSPTARDARRDRVEKVVDYARFGVRWYWLIDPELRTLEVLELGAEGRYLPALAVSHGVVEAVPGCEGLVVDVSALWHEVDLLEAESAG